MPRPVSMPMTPIQIDGNPTQSLDLDEMEEGLQIPLPVTIKHDESNYTTNGDWNNPGAAQSNNQVIDWDQNQADLIVPNDDSMAYEKSQVCEECTRTMFWRV